MQVCLPQLTPETFQAHPLHHPDRHWPETNCYIDLWIEVLNALGLPPEPAMAVAARQDFEGDQFGFTKIPLEDIETLYGLHVQELAVYDPVEVHVVRQMERGRLCLVEVDPFFLPDTGQAAYRRDHAKTTIGINRLNRDTGQLEYFHNAGYFRLGEEDFQGLFPTSGGSQLQLRPYVEFTTLEPLALSEAELRARGQELLAHAWARRPATNPIRRYQAILPEQAEALVGREAHAFHDYAFHYPRLLGSNFELLAACLDWLTPGQDPRTQRCLTIAEATKALPLHLAKALARRRFDVLSRTLDPAADAWDALFEASPSREAA